MQSRQISCDIVASLNMEIHRLRVMLCLERGGIDTTRFGTDELSYISNSFKARYTPAQTATVFSGKSLEVYDDYRSLYS